MEDPFFPTKDGRASLTIPLILRRADHGGAVVGEADQVDAVLFAVDRLLLAATRAARLRRGQQSSPNEQRGAAAAHLPFMHEYRLIDSSSLLLTNHSPSEEKLIELMASAWGGVAAAGVKRSSAARAKRNGGKI